MAIEHDIVIAVSLNQDGLIRLINVDESFNEYETKVADFIIDKVKPKWHDYFLAGVMGIVDKFGRRDLTGMNVCVHGQVPKSAGLSSSSALVVCSAMVTLYANKLELTRTELADLCAVSERHVGTQGGGMDQAISCLAESGAAKLIDFNPLRVTNVNLPAGSLFVITNSCVEMNKAATSHFNTRVAECRLSTQVNINLNHMNSNLKLVELIDIGQNERIGLEECKEAIRATTSTQSITTRHGRTCQVESTRDRVLVDRDIQATRCHRGRDRCD